MKKIVALLLAVTMIFGLAACGKKEEQVITVDFWSAPNQGQFDYWSTRAEAFNATNTQIDGKTIQVVVQQMPETPSSEAGIQNAIATGTVPAVSENINVGFASTLAASEAVYDIQDEAWYKTIVANRAIESAVEGWTIGGKQYVIPIYINPMSFQWNVKALDIMGIDVPETIDDFNAMLAAFAERKADLEAAGITHTFYRPALLRADQWWERWYDFQMVYQSLNGPDNWVDGNSLTFTKEGMVKAMEFIGSMGNTIMTGEIEPLWSADVVPIVFSINAPWEISTLKENGKEYGVDYIYGPTMVEKEGNTAYSYADSKGLVFYKHESISDEEHQGAIQFISWVYNAENSAVNDLEWLNVTNMMPVRGDLETNETFAAKFEELPALKGLAAYIPNAIPSMAHEKMTEIQTAFTEAGLVPYMGEVMSVEPLNTPDPSSYVDAAIEAMKTAGGLE